MLIERCLQLRLGPWIHLFEKDDANAEVLALFALDAKVVADLSAADEEAAGIFYVVVGEDVFEGRLAEFRDG